MANQDKVISTRDIRFVAFTIVAMFAMNIPAGIYREGWMSAASHTALFCVLFVIYIIRYRDSYLLGWAILGVAGGFTELIADWWLVNRTESLVYAPGEPMLVASPMYMPFDWALILLQLGVVAHWLRERFSPIKAAVITGLIGGVNIPLYESLARAADWWVYQKTPMLMGAPYYIILGEVLIVVPLVWLSVWLVKMGPVKGGILLGIVEGLIILVAYMIAWWLVGPCEGAVIQFACS